MPVAGEAMQKNGREAGSGDEVDAGGEEEAHCSQQCGGWAAPEEGGGEVEAETQGQQHVEGAKQLYELHFACMQRCAVDAEHCTAKQ